MNHSILPQNKITSLKKEIVKGKISQSLESLFLSIIWVFCSVIIVASINFAHDKLLDNLTSISIYLELMFHYFSININDWLLTLFKMIFLLLTMFIKIIALTLSVIGALAIIWFAFSLMFLIINLFYFKLQHIKEQKIQTIP